MGKSMVSGEDFPKKTNPLRIAIPQENNDENLISTIFIPSFSQLSDIQLQLQIFRGPNL